jgi:exo-beta-1,3-glucanase (GH17 family)
MKAGVFSVAAAMATGVSAGTHHAGRRHAHEAFHMGRGLTTGTLSNGTGPDATCGCTTVYYTITGEGVLHTPSPAVTYSSMTVPTPVATPVTTPAAVVAPTSSLPVTVPTAFVTVCPTPGVYTIPATTITLTEEVTVCAPASTTVPAGTNVAGGVVTVVETSTTVVCPYAAISTSGGVVTSVVETTTTVCPSAGTYTIAPLTTVCEVETVWVYPTPTSYPAGVYTQAELVVTVTETDFVLFCPYATSAPAVVAAPAPTSAAPIVAQVVTSAAPVATKPASNGSGLGTSGKQWAMVYSPFYNNDQCKSKTDIYNDIQKIADKGFTSVRVYGTVCSSLEYIGGACAQYGLKMILGIFIDVTGIQGAQCQEQVTEIAAWAKWELVELLVIGNEAIFNGWCTASELAAFIQVCKNTFSYTGPYTTTEPLNIWQESETTSALCSIIEYVGCNIHPFFNADISSSQAGAFVASQLQIVDGLCSGLTGVNLETGWPSYSSPCNGAACGTTTDQAIAIQGIADSSGGISVILSYANDLWKDAGDFSCEQSWGAIDLYPIE